jgi:hypothetical protein
MKKIYLSLLFLNLSVSVFSSDIDNIAVERELKVHKTSTCGCCKKWIEYMKNEGYVINAEDHYDLEKIKKFYGITPAYRSCHTAVSSSGYVFEGHIPSRYIEKFLEEKIPNAVGLSVPGMPLGSPGMEFGDRKITYDVLILFKDRSSKVFATVSK